MAISGDCPLEIPLGLSIGLVVWPDSHRICHWTVTGNFHQFSALKIGVFRSGFRWVSVRSPPENVGECKDLMFYCHVHNIQIY